MKILGTQHALVVLSYFSLIILQPLWHALLPPPSGAGLWWLAVLATVPLLLPFKGIVLGSLRSMTWAGYLLMLYFAIGVMEAWSNPAQRLCALVQIGLVVVCLISILKFSRQNP